MKRVPITCANINHDAGQPLGYVELPDDAPAELAATAYICEACAARWRDQLAEVLADPGPAPTAVDA